MPEQHNLISNRLYSALDLTFSLFGRDARKSSPVPAMAHLLSVCALVQLDGGDEEEAIAALFHDTLEDKADKISRELLRERFGERVLNIVEVSTDTSSDYVGGPKEPWKIRKTRYIEHIKLVDPSFLRVTVADKVDNARAILADHRRVGEEVWRRFNATRQEIIWYYTESLNAYREARFSGPILEELENLVEKLQVLS